MPHHKFRAGFLFCGLGFGPDGFCSAFANLGHDTAVFENAGGIDFDPAACADYEKVTGAKSLCADIAKLQPADILKFFGPQRLDMVFFSSPCKGLSQLLPAEAAKKQEYQDMNALFFKGVNLICAAWPRDPPPLLLFENVPGIMGKRGIGTLTQTLALCHAHGFKTDCYVHELGEVGGLGARRKRFLLAARRPDVIPAPIYKAPKQRMKSCGEVISAAPVPLSLEAALHPHHVMPNISLLNLARLSYIPAGGDHRDLPPRLEPQRGNKRKDHSKFRVEDSTKPAHTVTGASRPGSGAPAIDDARVYELLVLQKSGANAIAKGKSKGFKGRPGLFGVADFNAPLPTVTAGMSVSGGNTTSAVADPRLALGHAPFRGTFGVQDWNAEGATVTGRFNIRQAAAAIADPRLAAPKGSRNGYYGVNAWDKASVTVTGSMCHDNTAAAVQDPRWYNISSVALARLLSPMREGDERRKHFRRDRMLKWNEPADTVTGPGGNSGAQYIADPRASSPGPLIVTLDTAMRAIAKLPIKLLQRAPATPLVIVAPDGTWHRPLTDLELALLQGMSMFFRDGSPLMLSQDRTMSTPRERIGNAVPRLAAQAMGKPFLKGLLASKLGGWQIEMDGIWVRKEGRRSEHEWRQADHLHGEHAA